MPCVASGRVSPGINELNLDGRFFLSVPWVSQELAKEGKLDTIRLIRQAENGELSGKTFRFKRLCHSDPVVHVRVCMMLVDAGVGVQDVTGTYRGHEDA